MTTRRVRRPRRAAAKVRSRNYWLAQLKAAPTPLDEIAVMTDWLRQKVKAAPPDVQRAIADGVTTSLLSYIDITVKRTEEAA